jgi:hypothetical protein
MMGWLMFTLTWPDFIAEQVLELASLASNFLIESSPAKSELRAYPHPKAAIPYRIPGASSAMDHDGISPQPRVYVDPH